MSTPFNQTIQFHKPDDVVSAANVNLPLQQLSQRTISLNERLNNSNLSSSLMLYDVPLSGENVEPGMAVYRDADNVFQPAFAKLKLSSDGISYTLADSALAWGVVQSKSTATSGNVLLYGLMEISETQLLSILVEDEVLEEPIFISAVPNTEGKLTYRRPPYGVAVGLVRSTSSVNSTGDSLYTFFVSPRWNDPYEDHIHYRTSLSTDESSTTWDSSFDTDLAPAGATYKYSIDDDENLSNIWPPIPLKAVHIERDGVTANTTDDDPEIVVNEYGIWWTDYNSDPSDFERIELYFTRMTFKTSNTVVTSIAPGNDAVSIINEYGDQAVTGDLKISFAFSISEDTSTVEGSAVKEIDNATVKYGDVVDNIRTNTPSVVQLNGLSAGGGFKGNVSIDVSPIPLRDNSMGFTELDNVDLANDNDIYYLLVNTGGTLISRFRVPESSGSGDFDCTINLAMWARSSGAAPALSLDYKIINGLTSTPSNLSTSFTAGSITPPSGPYTAGEAFTVAATLGDTVEAGDIVYVRITKTSGSTEIGILDQWWSLEVS